MGFVDAVNSGIRRFVDFNTRSSRSEYWWWMLFVILVSIPLYYIDYIVFVGDIAQKMQTMEPIIFPLATIFGLITFLPGLAVTVRRLHDVGRSGWWFLIILVPLIGLIVILVWTFMKGKAEDNKWGSNPLNT